MEARQPVDQAGFRARFSCEDHLLTTSKIIEQFNEHNRKLWVCAIDFQKAFDTVEHDHLFAALRAQGIEETYVSVLQRLYSGQAGIIVTELESKEFNIGRGTKQGDPLSPILFSAVLQHALADTISHWIKRKKGIKIGPLEEQRLTNLRFADDILLFAISKADIRKMLTELQEAASTVGLQLHMGKTKIMTNTHQNDAHVQIGDDKVEILPPDGCTAYLGRNLSLLNSHDVELEHRLKTAWSKFMCHKHILCNKAYPLHQRLKVFDSTVTNTALYGSGVWAMTEERRIKLKTTQRRMLRWMLGSGRRRVQETPGSDESDGEIAEPDDGKDQAAENDKIEDWVSWIKRTTQMAETHMQRARVEDWIAGQRRRKWRLAGRAVAATDNRWTQKVLNWQIDVSCRRRGRPPTRWEDDVAAFVATECNVPKSDWKSIAADSQRWHLLEQAFVQY